MVVKVKEPQEQERAQLHEGQVLYTYLHLAPDPEQTADLVKSGVTAIAYEDRDRPRRARCRLLKPMSQVAGRMSIRPAPPRSRRRMAGAGCCSAGCPE
jgi:alanine dehydrogenase